LARRAVFDPAKPILARINFKSNRSEFAPI
jgi:hypothetical protein